MQLYGNTLRKLIYSIYIPAVLFIITIFIVSLLIKVPIEHFTGDPDAVFKAGPYVGLLSNIGLFFWSFTAAICYFLYSALDKHINKSSAAFFFYSAIFNLVLLIDDSFMLHEYVLPNYLYIPQKIVYLSYLLLTLYYLYRFRLIILSTNYILLGTSFIFFILSVSFDTLFRSVPYEALFEDGFKFLGIVTWFNYFYSTCKKYLFTVIADKKPLDIM